MTEPVWDDLTKRWSDDDPKTDAEKHAYCQRRSGMNAIFIPQVLYDLAERAGYDMRPYVVVKLIPKSSEPTYPRPKK